MPAKIRTADDRRMQNMRNARKPRRFGRRLHFNAVTKHKGRILLRLTCQNRPHYCVFLQKDAAWLRDLLTEMIKHA